jgi:Secretion system C-terminal sorting domain
MKTPLPCSSLKKYSSIAGFIVFSFISFSTYSQCFCTAGSVPDSITQTRAFDPITAVNTPVVFQRFNPAVGTLNCFKLSSNVTTIVDFDLLNKQSSTEDYLLEYYKRSRFTGPSGFLSLLQSDPKEHGIFTLLGFDGPMSDLDQVHIGPDTVFYNTYQEKYAPGSAPYTGIGNVSFTYLSSSTTSFLLGTNNYDLQVRDNTKLNVTLTYYYCANAILAGNIRNFLATKKEGVVQLSWQATNGGAIGTFVIERSLDGKAFNPVAEIAGTRKENDKYNFEYLITNTNKTLFFRIKQTDDRGKTTYSVIQMVTQSLKANAGLSVFPNPAKDHVSIHFDPPANGSYQVELADMAGKVIDSYHSKLTNAHSLTVNWSQQPVAGVYLLRITNKGTELQQTLRLTVH